MSESQKAITSWRGPRVIIIIIVGLAVILVIVIAIVIARARLGGTPSVAGRPAGTYTSTLDQAVSGRRVDRDCGFSAATSSRRSVWVFCDTAIFDPGQPVVLINSATAGSAAIAPGRAPQIDEALDTKKLPRQFIPTPPGDCPDKRNDYESSYWGYWTIGVTTLPDPSGQPGNLVVDFYTKYCVVALDANPPSSVNPSDYPKYVPHGEGVGSFTYDGSAGTSPLAVPLDRMHDLWAAEKCGEVLIAGYGGSAMVVNGYLYVYRTASSGCYDVRLARVKLDRPTAGDAVVAPFEDVRNYEYWTGSDWGPRAGSLTVRGMDAYRQGTDMSVAYLPEANRFVMIVSASIWTSSVILVRIADRPEGPWSNPMTIDMPDCGTGATSMSCRAWALHPTLDDGSSIWFSYYQMPTGERDKGRVKLATIPTSALEQLSTPA